MLSLRSLARSTPRTLSRLAAPSTSPALRRTIAGAGAVRPSALLKLSQGVLLRPSPAAPFSTSVGLRASSGETDEELSAKLESELQFEEEASQDEQVPASVKDFLDNSPFELEDVAGREDVKLTRTFGEEKITITFSISELNDFDPYEEDRALEDEDEFNEDALQNPNAKRDGAKAAAQPGEEEAGEDEYDGAGEDEVAPPCRLNIVIEKPGKGPGALNVLANAQDGIITVENMFYFEDAALAHSASADLAHKRGDVYPGPAFGTLDEDLQILMERYLEERGVTQALAVFVPDYMDVKEQREYVRWLDNVKKFIDA